MLMNQPSLNAADPLSKVEPRDSNGWTRVTFRAADRKNPSARAVRRRPARTWSGRLQRLILRGIGRSIA